MTTQPETLRLADELEMWTLGEPAAAELRRLHTENERLHQINQSHEMKLSVRGYEIQIADLEAQRDALLEALRAIVHAATVHACHHALSVDGQQFYDIARAAIKAVEENT